MHCWKVINIKNEYGTLRLLLLNIIIFVFVFSFSFIIFEEIHPSKYTDDYLLLFILSIFLVYPIHKLIHYVSLTKYRKSVKLKLKFEYKLIPILNLRIKTMIPKYHYIFTLLSPFFLLNALFIYLSIAYPYYSHYTCILLAIHCSMSLPDLLYVKYLFKAPHHAIIEETPKGYEILVPLYEN